jgi:hypothetical protein
VIALTESQLLKGASVCLRVEEVDEGELEEDPATVDGEELPADGGQGNGVDISGEEAAELSENLLDSDTHGTLGVGEEFD